MKEGISIVKIEGLDDSLFDDFKEYSETTKVHTEGAQANWETKVLDYIIIATLVVPFDLVRDLLKDQSKKPLKRLAKKILILWNKVKSTKPAIIRSNSEPQHKEPKVKIVFPISETEHSTLELSNEVSNSITEQAIGKYFELLELQIQNRLKEDSMKKEIKLPIDNKNATSR